MDVKERVRLLRRVHQGNLFNAPGEWYSFFDRDPTTLKDLQYVLGSRFLSYRKYEPRLSIKVSDVDIANDIPKDALRNRIQRLVEIEQAAIKLAARADCAFLKNWLLLYYPDLRPQKKPRAVRKAEEKIRQRATRKRGR